jgi:DNA-binding transcriptional ArsR family regulator
VEENQVDDKAIAALRRLGQGARGVEDSVSFSLGHRLRIEIRAALHDGPATSSTLAGIASQPRGNLDYHLKEMLNDGSIDIAKTVKVGNIDQHYYSVPRLPHFSNAEVAALSRTDRQTLRALAVQTGSTEALASLWAGKMTRDPRLMLAWNRLALDKLGREELADEEAASWCRKHEIAARSANRRAKTGEPGVTYVITSWGYERSRTAAPNPLPSGESSSNGMTMANRTAAVQHWGKEGRGVEDSVSYSLGHRVRIEIRAALHEGPATASQLAEMIRVPINTIDYHIKELLKDRSIDIAKSVKVGNITQHYYSVTSLPYFSDEEVATMSEKDRQTLCAIAVQAVLAEAMASLWAGKMADDPLAFLASECINLDKQGRDELADEETASWRRKHEIEARSANRRAKTGEAGVTYVITSMGYERSRPSAPEPLNEDSPPSEKS